MAVGRNWGNFAQQYNSLYNITVDLSGWDKVSVHVYGLTGTITPKFSNNSGAVQGVTQGNAELATQFTPTQVFDVDTTNPITSITTDGVFYQNVNAQFFQLEAGLKDAGSSVTELILYTTKIG